MPFSDKVLGVKHCPAGLQVASLSEVSTAGSRKDAY